MIANADASKFVVETICVAIGFACVSTGSYLLQKSWFRETDSFEAFMATIIIAFGWIVVSGEALGATGTASLQSRMLADALYLTFSLASFSKYYPDKQNLERTRGIVNSTSLKLIVLCGTIVAVATLAWGWVSPPPPWDAFVYHLSFPATWIKEGRIFPVTVPFGDQAGTYFPSNVELIYFWLMTYARQDFMTNTVQWFFMLTCVCAVYRLCRFAGADKSPALAAAFGVFFMPGLVHQAAASEVDIAFSAMFLAALYFTLRWLQVPNIRMTLILAFIAAGIFLGSKVIAIPFTAMILVPVLIYVLSRRGIKLWMLFGVAFSLATGSFWYVRNYLLTGNPLFPLTLKIGGVNILNGAYMRESVLESTFHTDSASEWFALLIQCWGLPMTALLAFGLALFVFSSATPKRKLLFAFLPLSVMALVFFVIPYNKEVRFTFTAYMMGLIPLSLFINIWRNRNRRFFYYALLAVYIANGFIPVDGHQMFHAQLFRHFINLFTRAHPIYRAMLPAAVCATASCVVIGAAAYHSIVSHKWNKTLSATMGAGLLMAAISFYVTASTYQNYQYQYYAGFPMGFSWNALHSIAPHPIRVAYTGSDLSYGLFGPWMKNSVFTVPINRQGMSRFHQCNEYQKKIGAYKLPKTDRIDFCRRDPSYEAWRKKLVEMGADVLFVTILHQNDRPYLAHDADLFPIERQWADANTDMFRLLFSNSETRIYKIVY